MCGIAGLIDKGGVDVSQIPVMLQVLSHRGPDDSGYLLYTPEGVQLCHASAVPKQRAEVALAHRRLSIVDLSANGWQPMGSCDGRYYIVFNGEIYNYVELREELRHLGNTFRSSSDTEVLLTGFAQWGPAVLSRLVGMFAFALLDTHDRKVYLVRDFFGIKPLYYATIAGGVAFASELKGLLKFSSVARDANPERLLLYLRHGVTDHGCDTLFSAIQQVPSGHYLEISIDAPRAMHLACYWRPTVQERRDISFDEAADELRELFLQSIRLHLRSDVPVGAALSGGIDSASIVMAMRKLEPGLDIQTFSYVADDTKLTEESWIDIVVAASQATGHKVSPTPDELVGDLDQLTFTQDEPFGSTSIYAQYRVFQMAHHAGIKVMLDGQGADEILGGYRYYMGARLASLIRQNRWNEATQFLMRSSQWPGAGKLLLLFSAADHLLPQSIQPPLRAMIGKDLMPRWLSGAWFARNGVSARPLNYSPASDILHQSLCRELTQTSLPHLLRYEDRNSMAFSIESRVPFLTPQLVDFMFSLPEHYIISGDGTSKAVFRRAMRGILPDAILNRRDKIGFATPERNWLGALNGWVGQHMSSEVAHSIPFLNLRFMEEDWKRVLDGRRPFDFRFWRSLNLIRWTEQFDVHYA